MKIRCLWFMINIDWPCQYIIIWFLYHEFTFIFKNAFPNFWFFILEYFNFFFVCQLCLPILFFLQKQFFFIFLHFLYFPSVFNSIVKVLLCIFSFFSLMFQLFFVIDTTYILSFFASLVICVFIYVFTAISLTYMTLRDIGLIFYWNLRNWSVIKSFYFNSSFFFLEHVNMKWYFLCKLSLSCFMVFNNRHPISFVLNIGILTMAHLLYAIFKWHYVYLIDIDFVLFH